MAKFVDATRGLTWVRLDCAFPRNPKVTELAHMKAWRSIAVYIGGLSYSGEQGLDGFLPASCMQWIYGTPKDADNLIRVGLWHAVTGGWEINDWHDYQPSAEEAQARRDKARHAAEVRWGRERANEALNLKAVEQR